MRALSILQPWAGLIASGIKLVENRSRLFVPRQEFGRTFAVHAGLGFDDDALEAVHRIAPEVTRDLPAAWFKGSQRRGAVIAVATIDLAVTTWHDGTIVDAYGKNGGPVVDLGDQRRWFFGPFGYVMRDVRELVNPVQCKGRLGFWTLPDDVERAVLAQIGAP